MATDPVEFGLGKIVSHDINHLQVESRRKVERKESENRTQQGGRTLVGRLRMSGWAGIRRQAFLSHPMINSFYGAVTHELRIEIFDGALANAVVR